VLWLIDSLGSPALKNNAFAVAIGLLLGFAMVWWVQPDPATGAVFIVVASTLVCFITSVVLTVVGKLFAAARGRSAGGTDDIT
jgi:hypothetical protein